jgi:hypothetical protein
MPMPTFIELLQNQKTGQLIQGIVQLAGGFIMENLQGNDDAEKKALDRYYSKASALAKKMEQKKNNILQTKGIPSPDEEIDIPEIETKKPEEKVSVRDTNTTACIACARDHIAAAAGLLSEGKRFLKDGLKNDEVLSRIDLATQEIATMERGDLHPDKIMRLPEDERQIAEWLAEEVRRIRHILDHISTKENYLNAIHELTLFSKDMTKRYYAMMEHSSPEKIQKSIEHLCEKYTDEGKRLKCMETMTSITK